MAKITKKQIDAIDAACRNGFSFDQYDFGVSGDKSLSKTITLVEGRKAVKLRLSWQDEVVKHKNRYGCTVPTYTGNVVPLLHCSVWHKHTESDCWHSYGLGVFRTFSDRKSSKRLMKSLCEITELVTDELMCEMLPERECEEFRQKAEQANKQ
uniref:Uncharacterized protein n=1 Tax=virus sp. ct5rm7 TaxID=2827298 RepID=A0A8S5RH82_9VIRU|nr:MAG TPA: hypothetical protein [virus sp. ct5rm7]